jgi:hypothetical protein
VPQRAAYFKKMNEIKKNPLTNQPSERGRRPKSIIIGDEKWDLTPNTNGIW